MQFVKPVLCLMCSLPCIFLSLVAAHLIYTYAEASRAATVFTAEGQYLEVTAKFQVEELRKKETTNSSDHKERNQSEPFFSEHTKESWTTNSSDRLETENYNQRESLSTMPLVLGRTPERVTVPGSSGMFISVKTTAKYHESRLSLLLLTWLQTVSPEQVHIVTDVSKNVSQNDNFRATLKNAGFHVTETNCPIGRQNSGLCCKSGAEYDQYYSTVENGEEFGWFCRFDDDVYVNIPLLVATLEQYNPREEKLYLGQNLRKKGKKELAAPILKAFPEHKSSSFYWATGAAYCISSALMTYVEPYLRGTAFERTAKKLILPDDMTVGAVIGAILGEELINIPTLNCHYQRLGTLVPHTLKDQVTVSYALMRRVTVRSKGVRKEVLEPTRNLINIPNATFSEEEDPTRLLSYHCLLFPATSWCNS